MTKEDQAKRNRAYYRELWRGATVPIVDTQDMERKVKG